MAPHNLHAQGDNPPAAGHIRFRRLDTADGLSQNGVRVILQDRRGLMWFGAGVLNRFNPEGEGLSQHTPAEGQPWWATFWFRGLIVAAGAALIFGLYYWRGHAIHVQNRRLETLAAERTHALRVSEERFRSMAQTAADAMITINADGKIILFNRAAEKIFGYSSREVMGQPLEILIPPSYRARHKAAISRYLESGQPTIIGQTIELEAMRQGDELFPIELSLSDAWVDDEVTFIGIIRDITERKQIEDALQKLSRVVEQTADIVMITNTRGVIEYVNPAFEELTGYTQAEVAGQTSHFLKSGEHDRQFYQNLWQTILAGQVFRGVLKNRKRDGSFYYEEKTITPLKDKQDRITHFVSTGKEITERVQAETALQQRNRELALINRAGQSFGSTLEPDQVFISILQEIHNLLDITSTSLWLRLSESGEMVCQHAIGPGADKIIGWRLAPGQGLTGQTAQTGETLIVADTRTDPRHFKEVDREAGVETRSLLNLPLKAKGEVIGVLNLVDTKVGRFTADDLRLLEPIAAAAAGAIENAHLFEAEHIALEQTKTLYAASLALTATINLQQVLENILIELQKVVPYDSASVQHLKGETMEVIAGTGFPNLSEVLGLQLDIKTNTLDQEIIHNKTPLILENATQHPEFQFRRDVEFGIRAWLGVPLLFGDRVIGKITLDKKEPNYYTQKHAQLALAFAAQAAIAIENARLYASVQEARAAAESANQAKSTFLAHMSHELRTPLNSILGYTQILKRDPAMRSPQQKHLGIIEQSGHHLLTLIEDVLDLAKIEAGKIILEPSTFSLLPFLQTIVEIIEVRAALKGLEFHFNIDPSLRKITGQHIRADERRLRQVLINLLDNAVKFTEAGRVTLRVTANDERGMINNEPVTGVIHHSSFIILHFEVEDTGPGIAPADLQTIFEPFHQANTSRYQPGGAGLGLAISQELVALMGGQIQVESITQKPTLNETQESKIQNPKSQIATGSRFWFDLSLPLILPAQSDIQSEIQGAIIGFELADKSPPRILVIDDRASNRTLLADLLAPLGFELLEATDGHTGLDLALTHRPEVIITDLVMSGLDGFELIRRVRREESLPQPVIIAISASAYRHDREHSLAAGSDAFLPKPVDIAALLALLEKHLNLTWVYQSPSEAPPEPAPGRPFISPPPNIVAQLLELANMGDITALQEQAQQLAHQNPVWQPFAAELLNLAATYQVRKICRWLENQLKIKN